MNNQKNTSILQINYLENKGGAARIAWTLHQSYRAAGIPSRMAVGLKFSQDEQVFPIPNDIARPPLPRLLLALQKCLQQKDLTILGKKLSSLPYRLAHLDAWWLKQMGVEDNNFPGTGMMLESLNQPPDIIHCHNLHENYFDLRVLPTLSHKFPFVITLHDCWLMTGHCAHFLDCDRWMQGCGKCPYLSSAPEVKRDQTALNWKRKRDIFLASKLNLVTPSQWMMDIAQRSILLPAIHKASVIHNGIDLTIFKPDDKDSARNALGLPQDAIILLFVVSGDMLRNSYKDYDTIERAIQVVTLNKRKKKILFIGLGDQDSIRKIGNLEIRFVPFQEELETIARYYQAADIYLHAAKVDNFPNVILESLACGTPVIATAVGGIPEQIHDGKTGFLVAAADYYGMAEKIIFLIENEQIRREFSQHAAQDARDRFDSKLMMNNYLNFYEEIIK